MPQTHDAQRSASAFRRRAGRLGALTFVLSLLLAAGATAAVARSRAAVAIGRAAVGAGATLDLRAAIAAEPLSPEPRAEQQVLLAQSLFRELGYPLGRDRPGRLGVATRGALEYFQRKYGLSVSGQPDAATLAQMEAVETALRAAPASAPIALAPAVLAPTRGTYSAQTRPRDLVERLVGDELPFLAIAIALSGLLALLALSAHRAGGDDSDGTRGSTAAASGEG